METQANKIIKVDEKLAGKYIDIARKIVSDGGVVAFPTETVYGLAADVRNDVGLEKLNQLKKRLPDKPYTVHIASRNSLRRFVPDPIPWFAQILALKGWPGPITLVIELTEEQIAECKSQFGKLFERIYYQNAIGLRCPAHPVVRSLLDNDEMIIVAPSANPANQPPAINAKEVIDYFGDEVDLVLDGGEVRYLKPSTVIKISRDSYKILREGVMDKRAVDKLTSFNVMFVCTGNTCRSPMAEAWAKKLIAEHIGCDVSELAKYKVNVSSAGTFAGFGMPASELAVRVIKNYGIDLSEHVSQPITKPKLLESDIIYVMTEGHKDFINSLAPEVSNRVKLMKKGGVHDPIGGTEQEYARICQLLKEAIETQIKELFQ